MWWEETRWQLCQDKVAVLHFHSQRRPACRQLVGSCMARIGWTSILLAAIPILFAIRRTLQQPRRFLKISKNEERVLILGASGGIGRAIAHIYAARGARVCIVGRRKTQVDDVVAECSVASGTRSAFGVVGDFSNVDDMIRVRDALKSGE